MITAIDSNIGVRCAHCRLLVPPGLIEPEQSHQFCCAGCRAVYESVTACGLADYYRLRESAEMQFAPARPKQSKFEAFDTETFARLYVESQGDVKCVDLALEGISCGACVWLVEKLPTVLSGVIEARLNLRQAIVRVTFDSRTTKLSSIAQTLDRFGYRPSPARGHSRKEGYRRELRRRLIDLGAAGALAGNLMLLGAALYAGWFATMEAQFSLLFRIASLVLGAATLAWPGREFFRSAFIALRMRSINIDVPIAMALIAGGAAGTVNVVLGRGEIYFDSLAALVFLLLIGRFIQFQQQRRSETAVELLFSMTPTSCRVIDDRGVRSEIPIEALQPGMTAEVFPGELFPADGVVASGESSANLALLTGESRPAELRPGAQIYSGTQNGAATLCIKVTRCGQDTRLGALMNMVQRGLNDKPPIVRFTDRVAVWFVVIVSIVALLTFGSWMRHGISTAIDHAISLVIVTCPCVLGLAAPITMAVAIGRLARRDILVKSAAALERLAAGGELILDKTGTLTHGDLRVVAWQGDEELRGVVAAVEAESNHPVGSALRDGFEAIEPPAAWRMPVINRSQRGDGGVEAEINSQPVAIGSPAFIAKRVGKVPPEFACFCRDHESAGETVVFVSVNGNVRAAVALGDALREDAAHGIQRLRSLGFTPCIYSGDAQAVVSRVATCLHIEAAAAHGHKSPEQKLEAVRQARRPTVMVGDGVNDAAALAVAGVGIAVHGGAEASLAASDVYIARPGLSPIVELVLTARRAMRVVRANLAIALAYNILAGALAVAGMMTPFTAAILMPLSSATVLSLATFAMTRKHDGGSE